MGRVTIAVTIFQSFRSCTPSAVQQYTTDDMSTLAAFKREVAQSTGQVVRLKYRGQPVSEESQVYHFAPAAATVLRLSAKLEQPHAMHEPGHYPIFVKILNGQKLTLFVASTDTILNVKSKVEHESGNCIGSACSLVGIALALIVSYNSGIVAIWLSGSGSDTLCILSVAALLCMS